MVLTSVPLQESAGSVCLPPDQVHGGDDQSTGVSKVVLQQF